MLTLLSDNRNSAAGPFVGVEDVDLAPASNWAVLWHKYHFDNKKSACVGLFDFL
jgi:hypothetical protein